MAKYKVRKGFICQVAEGKINKTFGEGEIVDFTQQQFEDHAHKLEAYVEPKEDKKPEAPKAP